MPARTDRSSRYEEVAKSFAARRGASAVGLGTIQRWATQLPAGARVLDLGCGSGEPIAVELNRLGCRVAGIDASPTLIAAFHRRLSDAPWACEAVEDSRFFGSTFDAILAVGLLFLLPETAQKTLIGKVGDALEPDGHFLFTAPREACEWVDVLTGRKSVSLGAGGYKRLLHRSGLDVVESHVDEGENHYFACRKEGPRIASATSAFAGGRNA